MFVVMSSGNCELHTHFTFLHEILTSTYTKIFNIFFTYNMTRCPTISFQLSIMPKWLAKHISTKVSSKFTIRKRHVYIDIGWPWIGNQYFYLGIWNDDRTKIIVLPSFQLVTRINSQNRNETEFINVVSLFCIRILVFPVGIIEVSNPRMWIFYLISVPYTISDIQVPESL